MQSGTPLAVFTINTNPSRAFNILANQTGCRDGVVSSWSSSIKYFFDYEAQKRDERERALACLRRLDAKTLIRLAPLPEGEITPRALAVWVSNRLTMVVKQCQ